MARMTFVFEYEDGKEPAVNASTRFHDGKLVSVGFNVVDEQWIDQRNRKPNNREAVLLFSEDEGVIVGHYSSSCDEFFSCGRYVDSVTHWCQLPADPED